MQSTAGHDRTVPVCTNDASPVFFSPHLAHAGRFVVHFLPAVFVVVRYARRSAAFSGFMNERFIDEVMKPLGIELEWYDEEDIIETEAEVD